MDKRGQTRRPTGKTKQSHEKKLSKEMAKPREIVDLASEDEEGSKAHCVPKEIKMQRASICAKSVTMSPDTVPPSPPSVWLTYSDSPTSLVSSGTGGTRVERVERDLSFPPRSSKIPAASSSMVPAVAQQEIACPICDKVFSASSIERHVNQCLERQEKEGSRQGKESPQGKERARSSCPQRPPSCYSAGDLYERLALAWQVGRARETWLPDLSLKGKLASQGRHQAQAARRGHPLLEHPPRLESTQTPLRLFVKRMFDKC